MSTAVTPTPAEVAKRLDASLSDVAGALYDVDSSGDMVFVRAQADAGNAHAAGLVDSLGLAWERYPLAKEAVERLDAAVAAHDHTTVNLLLGPSAVTLPDGSTLGVAALLEDVALRVEHLGADVAAIAGAARRAVDRIDAARAAFADLMVRAGAVGADDDVELTSVRDAIERVTTAVAADPAAAGGLGDLDDRLAAARDRVEALERSHRELPGLLTRAVSRLHEIEQVVARGAESLAQTRQKIASPAGLIAPVPSGPSGDRALGPRLDRIRAQAASGPEEAAFASLTAWQHEADEVLADAKRVAAANAAPLGRRNELRGLLDAYRAKAAASGGGEDGGLTRLHAAAEDVLYTAPCDLDRAEALMRDYVVAVNAMIKGVR